MRTLAVLIVLMTTHVGWAQQTQQAPVDPNAEIDASELDQAARLLFESATRAYEAGNFSDALARYTNAYQLSERAPLLYNIAICHDRLEHKAEAADYYERFVAEVPDSPRVGIARSRAEILRASLSDNTNENETVDDPDDGPDGNPSRPGANEPSSRSLAGPIASFAVAGVGLITFAVSGLISSSRLSTAKATCETRCVPSELDGVDRTALIADIGLGVAIAGAAVGVVWLLVGGGSDADESSARLTPVASPSEFGAQLSGSF